MGKRELPAPQGARGKLRLRKKQITESQKLKKSQEVVIIFHCLAVFCSVISLHLVICINNRKKDFCHRCLLQFSRQSKAQLCGQ